MAKELKFIWEQTAHCTRDLRAVRQELAELKAEQETRHEEARMSMSAAMTEFLGLTRQDTGVLDSVINRVQDLERDVRGQWDEFDAVRRLIRDVELELSPELQELRALVGKMQDDHATRRPQLEGQREGLPEDPLGEVRLHQAAEHAPQQEADCRLPAQTTLLERKLESSLSQLADQLAHAEALPRGLHRGDLESHFAEIKSSIASGLSDFEETHRAEVRKLWSAIGSRHSPRALAAADRSPEHRSSRCDRFAFLEKSLGDSAGMHAGGMHSAKELEASHAAVVERVRRQAEASLDQLTRSRGGESDEASTSTCTDLAGPGLAPCGGACSADLGCLTCRAGHPEPNGALQSGAAQPWVLRAARADESRSGSLMERAESLDWMALQAAQSERLDDIRGLADGHAGSHAGELAAAKAIHLRTASLAQGLSQQHASLAERIESLERTFSESLLANSQEFRSAVSKLDRLQGRMSRVRAAWHREMEEADAFGSSGGSWDCVPMCVDDLPTARPGQG